MSEILKNKIDFVALLSVKMANPNGDPLNGNRPRQYTDERGNSLGEISDVCIKRKIRNRMQDFIQERHMDDKIFVQSEDRRTDDYASLKERAENEIGKVEKPSKGKKKENRKKVDTSTTTTDVSITKEEYAKRACAQYLDVRTFGQVFAFSDDSGEDSGNSGGTSGSVRGPVSIHHAVSVFPVKIESIQITKSVSGSPPKEGRSRASDTMGMKHFIRFGLYMVKGSINVQLAEKTGFTEEDAETVKECLRTLFVNDASSARPDGSMEVVRLFWFRHNCKDGQVSSAKVHHSVKVSRKDENKTPDSFGDYTVTVDDTELNGLAWEDVKDLR